MSPISMACSRRAISSESAPVSGLPTARNRSSNAEQKPSRNSRYVVATGAGVAAGAEHAPTVRTVRIRLTPRMHLRNMGGLRSGFEVCLGDAIHVGALHESTPWNRRCRQADSHISVRAASSSQARNAARPGSAELEETAVRDRTIGRLVEALVATLGLAGLSPFTTAAIRNTGTNPGR